MKKFLLLFVSLIVLSSCNIENDNPPNFFTEIVPIQSVDTPSTFVFGETYQISMTYIRPNDCYEFNDFFYQVNLNERTIAVINTVYTDSQCNTLNESTEVSFDFTVNNTSLHIFKFYQGTDINGVDQYHIVEIPVEQ